MSLNQSRLHTCKGIINLALIAVAGHFYSGQFHFFGCILISPCFQIEQEVKLHNFTSSHITFVLNPYNYQLLLLLKWGHSTAGSKTCSE
jgi:hypothetical protein